MTINNLQELQERIRHLADLVSEPFKTEDATEIARLQGELDALRSVEPLIRNLSQQLSSGPDDGDELD